MTFLTVDHDAPADLFVLQDTTKGFHGFPAIIAFVHCDEPVLESSPWEVGCTVPCYDLTWYHTWAKVVNGVYVPEPKAVEVPRHLQVYAMSYPCTRFGDYAVKQGHVDYCALKGHATYEENGVMGPICPRCGDFN